jgi:hypothetical protein
MQIAEWVYEHELCHVKELRGSPVAVQVYIRIAVHCFQFDLGFTGDGIQEEIAAQAVRG